TLRFPADYLRAGSVVASRLLNHTSSSCTPYPSQATGGRCFKPKMYVFILPLRIYQLVPRKASQINHLQTGSEKQVGAVNGRVAMAKMTAKNAARSFRVNKERSRISSVRLDPALPIISASTVPAPTPLDIRAAARGMTASARIYNGMPMTAAIGMAKGLSEPAYCSNKLVGMKP